MRLLGTALILSATLGAILPAQRMDDTRVAMQAEAVEMPSPARAVVVADSRTGASTKSMILGGIIGGALGAFGGASAGISVANCDRANAGEYCGLAAAIVGGVIGESIGLPIGVNYVANGRGSLRRSIPVSLTLTGVCLATAYQTAGTSILAMVPLQLLTSMRVERSGRAGVLGM